MKQSNDSNEAADLPGFKVGDRVKLQQGKTGVVFVFLFSRFLCICYHSYCCDQVRYIGKPDFSEEELVGIELDTWSANAGDGSVHGQQIFKTTAGRGFFCRRRSVAGIMCQSKITEGAYARLKGLIRVPKFNGKVVKVLGYVERKGRWKVKLLHAKQEKKYLGVKEEHLDPILDWEPINNPNRPREEALKVEPKVGDRVRTRKGRIGTVKYVGPVEFTNGSEVQIGLSLDQWDPNGHNGTVKDKKYFQTQDGRGYFVKLDNLVENMGPKQIAESSEQLNDEKEIPALKAGVAPLPVPPAVEIGDRIKLIKGKIGVVKVRDHGAIVC